MKTMVLFDIADQSFTFYTDEEWAKQIEEWRTELRDHENLDADYMDVWEVIECIGGDEYFYSKIV